MEWGVYCENFVMIGLTVDAGDHLQKRAAIPLAPCMCTWSRNFILALVFGSKNITWDGTWNNATIDSYRGKSIVILALVFIEKGTLYNQVCYGRIVYKIL